MKTKISFGKDEVPFTQIANEVLRDKNLSLKAKGLYAYLYSKPSDYQFSVFRIVDETNDGKKSIMSAINELEKAGLLLRKKQSDGRTIYWITYPPHNFEKPSTENRNVGIEPSAEKATLPKSHVAKKGTISNIDGLQSNKEGLQSNKYSETGVSLKKENLHKEIIDVINLFSELNPSIKVFYKNKTQRESAERLYKDFGIEKIKNAIIFIKQNIGKKYLPVITSPYELEVNLGKLGQFKAKEDKKTNNVLFV